MVIADETDISDIKQSWSLPETYLFLLQNYSPIKVFISGKKFVEGLQLYGADTMVKNQQAYMINPVTVKILKDWPKQFVVIGDDAGDPFCIDLSQISNKNAPVYTSIHGQGYWEFQKHSLSFTEFLKEIAARQELDNRCCNSSNKTPGIY